MAYRVPQEKATLIHEIDPIKELLEEVQHRLESLPRSAVAARQLSVIINKLDGWQKSYAPAPQATNDPAFNPKRPPTREEIDEALASYRVNGYFSLTDREKYIIEYFDQKYVKHG